MPPRVASSAPHTGPTARAARRSAPVSVRVRAARPSDARSIASIYNDAVRHTTATFDTTPRSLADQRRWLVEHGRPWVVLVAEEGGVVVGWASISRWSERRAYRETGEVSVYVGRAHRGRGVGRRLLRQLLAVGRSNGFHVLLARIADRNRASERLHRRFGFVRVGIMREVGRKFGRRIDVELLQRTYRGPWLRRPAAARD
jgi:L-amino acid N-acyltransferase